MFQGKEYYIHYAKSDWVSYTGIATHTFKKLKPDIQGNGNKLSNVLRKNMSALCMHFTGADVFLLHLPDMRTERPKHFSVCSEKSLKKIGVDGGSLTLIVLLLLLPVMREGSCDLFLFVASQTK